MPDIGPIIQGGALGLLAVVLYLGLRIARDMVKTAQRQNADRESAYQEMIARSQSAAATAQERAMAQRDDESRERREMFERTIQNNTAVMQHVATSNENLDTTIRAWAEKMAERPCLDTERFERRRL